MKLCYNDIDFDLLKIMFWALKMHQKTSLDVQIFKLSGGGPPRTPPTGGGHPLPYPPPCAPLPHGATPRHITESGRIQFPPATFYKNENPDCYSLIDAGLPPSVITH